MKGFLLADWTTLRGTAATPTVIQSEADYLDLSAYQDFVAWVEVQDVNTGGSTAQTLWLESAPTLDEVFFTGNSTGAQTSVPITVGLTTITNVLNAPLANGQIPLSRWLRWRVAMTAPGSLWSVTFRVHVAAHSVCVVAPSF